MAAWMCTPWLCARRPRCLAPRLAIFAGRSRTAKICSNQGISLPVMYSTLDIVREVMESFPNQEKSENNANLDHLHVAELLERPAHFIGDLLVFLRAVEHHALQIEQYILNAHIAHNVHCL